MLSKRALNKGFKCLFLCAEVIQYYGVAIKVNKTFNNDFLMIVVKQMLESRKCFIMLGQFIYYDLNTIHKFTTQINLFIEKCFNRHQNL